MGFGSYDESEQQDQDVETDDSEGVNVHENEHEGEVTFASEESTSDLVDRLQDIKDD
jgi:hypothetical protein